MFNCHPKQSGIYTVKDNVENLQFKIHFRSINTLLKLPKYDFHANLPAEQRKQSNVFADHSEDDCTTVTLSWQQKLLSPTECELYKNEKNCATEQQRKYHQQLKAEERQIALQEKKLNRKKRQRKVLKTDEIQMDNRKTNFIFTYVNDDHFEPIEELSLPKTNHDVKHESLEVMFVYADLKPDTLLVSLKWFKKEQLLVVYPDFNDFHHQPYFIELDTDYRHLYSYAIEDISLKMKPINMEAEEFLYLPELSTHWRYEDDLAQKFAMPPKRTQRCTLLFTITNASGFEYDNIHVRYYIKLPENTILEEGLLESSSHCASPFNSGNNCHINLTWQLTVLCEEQFDPANCLRIYFEVISIDSWERERLEGFCQYSVSLLKPFHGFVQLQCIRPVESLLDSLNRYFIGGRRKFDFIRFLDPNANDEVVEANGCDGNANVHCRYGVRMRNAGQLGLSCHSLTQRNCELLNPCASRTSGMTLDDIMMAYKEARRRLEAISLR